MNTPAFPNATSLRPRTSLPQLAVCLAAAAMLTFTGCDGGGQDHAHDDHDHDHSHDHSHDDHDHGHAHTAPHGGALIALGDHFAHVEVVLDNKTGDVTAYILDGEAENAIRLKDESITVHATLKPAEGDAPAEPLVLTLTAQANALTGEAVGDTSQFASQSDQLIGVTEFEGELQPLTIKGQAVPKTPFNFPKGNE